MHSAEKTHITALAVSMVDWWKLAGVDYLVDEEPVNWLATEDAPPSIQPAQPAISQPKIQPKPSEKPVPLEHKPVGQTTSAQWPLDLSTLQAAITDGTALPGNSYGGKSVAPVGEHNARLMIIGDLPDSEEIDAGRAGVGASGRLLSNMVKAIGYELVDCYITALASTRPATGELPEEDLSSLATFALHHIELVNPDKILILGSAACRALIGADLMAARSALPNINHIVGKKAAISTFHPRTLLARPTLKAQAWQDLQMIAKKDAL